MRVGTTFGYTGDDAGIYNRRASRMFDRHNRRRFTPLAIWAARDNSRKERAYNSAAFWTAEAARPIPPLDGFARRLMAACEMDEDEYYEYADYHSRD